MKSQLKINDKLWQEVKKQFPKINDVQLKVGIMSDKKADDGTSIAEYGAFNEFGTKTIPERPFMRTNYDSHQDKYNKFTERMLGGVLDLKMKPKQAFDFLGKLVADDLEAIVKGWILPRNADSTIAKKGSSRPLNDKGKLRDSFTWKVENV